ncbi:unnamed protein product [Prorocentrum cordatum]|uniref:EF-hand domain-containing protein n=1 Tax=Prorocentrum cordatum TaxID=2364126 RepID=A0ABN9UR05_9DINO|nr:unnamed protein product [Polarella glacialis]
MMTQLFHRMNKSGTGFLTVSELEETMESVASKCQVSEKWVRDTLAAFAMAVQQSGTAIKHMIPQKRVTLMQFRELFPKYVPSLRTSQLDRLWKYLQTEVSNDNPPRAHSEEWNHMDADSFAAVFGPTLGAAADTGDKFENNLTVGRRGSIGRDMLDELASHLLSHVGDAKLDMCFEALDPFLTPEHFHDQLRRPSSA